jgi:hypothetical protein
VILAVLEEPLCKRSEHLVMQEFYKGIEQVGNNKTPDERAEYSGESLSCTHKEAEIVQRHVETHTQCDYTESSDAPV